MGRCDNLGLRGRMRLLFILALWVTAAYACQSPLIPEGVYSCTQDRDCPSAWHCHFSAIPPGRCYKAAAQTTVLAAGHAAVETLANQAGMTGAAGVDARTDSSPVPRAMDAGSGGAVAVTDACRPNPCKNGDCAVEQATFRCSCRSGFSGRLCDQESTNACGADNGGCEQRCVADAPDRSHCECEPGASLKENGKDCWSWHASIKVNETPGPSPGTSVITLDAGDEALLVWSGSTQLWSRRKPATGAWAMQLAVPVPPSAASGMSTGPNSVGLARSADGTAVVSWGLLDVGIANPMEVCWISRFTAVAGWSAATRLAHNCVSWT
ncbi:MAG: vitamin K-dependent protein, partial [Pseudomonadota bacterium]